MWHEARRVEKVVHGQMDAAKKRAERRAIFLAKRRGDPNQTLRIVGTVSRVHHDVGLYQAAEERQGMIPWNGKEDNLIDRFDGRALLDFIREYDPRRQPPRQKTEEEEEVEERANFERYRDLVKQRRSGLTDQQGLEDVEREIEARASAPIAGQERQAAPGSVPAGQGGQGTYGKVGFSYGTQESDQESEESEDEKQSESSLSSEDSEDEKIVTLGRQYGVEDFNRMVALERKAKEDEKMQKDATRGDPSVKKLSRTERRKMARQGKSRDYDAIARAMDKFSAPPPPHPPPPPPRERRRSPTYEPYPTSKRSRSPELRSTRRDRDRDWDQGRNRDGNRDRDRAGGRNGSRDGEREGDRDRDFQRRHGGPRIEFITEFGVATDGSQRPTPDSPPSHRNFSGRSAQPGSTPILEALRNDPAASGLPTPTLHPSAAERERERRMRDPRASPGSSSTSISKLTKSNGERSGGKKGEKKETPQERLKRIMSKQLTKQIKKDSAADSAKKADVDRQLRDRAEQTRRQARHRNRSPTRTRSRSRSPSPYHERRARSSTRSPTRRYSTHSHSRSPKARSRSRHRDRSRSP